MSKNTNIQEKHRLFKKTRKREIFAFIAFFLLLAENPVFSVDFRRAETWEDVHSASCRVTAGNSRGTGTFFEYKNGAGYIVTCCHVVDTTKEVTLDYWGNSVQQAVKGRVVWRAFDRQLPVDASIIAVDARTLKDVVDPAFVPLGGPDARPGRDSYIISSGAPDGRFTQMWKGKTVGYYQGSTVLFSPPPVPGQSGSSICEYIDGEIFITGILTWLIGEKGRDDSKGGAIPVANIYEAARRGKNIPTALEESPCPIPPDATECSAIDDVNQIVGAPTVFFYSSPGCQACKTVEKDVTKLSGDGVKVQKIDTSTDEGLELARDDGVKAIPAIVIERGNERERIDADVLLKEGLYEAVRRRLQKPQPTPSASAEEQEPAETLWSREPVRDDADAINEILDESESRWLSRGKKGTPPAQEQEPEPAPEPEPRRPSPSILPGAGDRDASKFGDRIADRLANALGARIENEARKLGTKLEGEIQKKLDGYEKEIKDSIVGAINAKIRRAWTVVKRTVFIVGGVVVFYLIVWRRKKSNGQLS